MTHTITRYDIDDNGEYKPTAVFSFSTHKAMEASLAKSLAFIEKHKLSQILEPFSIG